MSKQHIIIIHGRATKPSEAEKKRLVKKTLLNGLERVSPKAAEKVRTGDVKFSFAYYGHINNREMMKAGKKTKADLKGRDEKHGNAPCELKGSYDTDLEKLFSRTSFTKADYKKILKEEDDVRFIDNAASFASGVVNLLGLSDNIIRSATPDMGAYLTTRQVGSEIRETLQKYLKPSLSRGEDICLISHSMGCIVSYDVLWKFSRMSEYKELRDKRVSRWITLGNPLGEPGVQDNLYDANERKDGKYPTNIGDWINIAAYDDFVSHDEDMANDFEDMKKAGFATSITDHRIYNLWTGSSGSNPHKHYGYLDHPDVARHIVDWMR